LAGSSAKAQEAAVKKSAYAARGNRMAKTPRIGPRKKADFITRINTDLVKDLV